MKLLEYTRNYLNKEVCFAKKIDENDNFTVYKVKYVEGSGK